MSAPWRRLRLAAGAAGLAVAAVLAAAAALRLAPAPLPPDPEFSALVVDRHGGLLRPYAIGGGRWRIAASPDEVDPRFVAALLAREDKRYYSHFGVDPLALARAGWQLLRNGRIVSGGSTLTMQVARLLGPREERGVITKLRQIALAVALERSLSKREILALYLGLAPYGGNIEGLRAATLTWFGKEPRRLSVAEIALLVALPQSPEARRPDRAPAVARLARDRVLDRIGDALRIPADEIAQAKAEPVPEQRRPMPALAPHAADQAIAASPDRAIAMAPQQRLIRLTLDGPLQRRLEALARDRARALGPDLSVAIVAVDQASGEILARVASADYFDPQRAGQVDMTAALRSPGSTLKPFIYGLALEDGLVHPETLIDDRPLRFGSYAPENFDLTFQGTVSVRRALQLSLNVPAVALLEAVRASRLAARLADTGAALVLPGEEAPGLAIGLGGAGVRLSDLAMLYAGIARLGTVVPLSERRDGRREAAARRLMDPVSAWYVGNILLGTPPPEHAPGGRIAFKTGTSYGYRDAWAVGFDGKATIAVWVGRPDGAPVPGLIGRASAAPILFDAFSRLDRPLAPLPPAPKGAFMSTNARLPAPLQRFRPGALAGANADAPPLRILFPPNGARLERAGRADPLALKIAGGVMPLTVLVNGMPLAQGRDHVRNNSTIFWEPDGPGFVRLTVMDARGAAESVLVRVQEPRDAPQP
jgi:penicillin-binding protein 1C